MRLPVSHDFVNKFQEKLLYNILFHNIRELFVSFKSIKELMKHDSRVHAYHFYHSITDVISSNSFSFDEKKKKHRRGCLVLRLSYFPYHKVQIRIKTTLSTRFFFLFERIDRGHSVLRQAGSAVICFNCCDFLQKKNKVGNDSSLFV